MTLWHLAPRADAADPFALSGHDEDWVFVSGVDGRDPATGLMPDDADQQCRIALSRIQAVLAKAGSDLGEVVYFRPYVTDRAHAMAMDAVLEDILPRPRPVCGALLIVGLRDPEAKLELEVWARRGAKLVSA